MASSPDRSNLKNWLPGAAGILILFALVGYAGISKGQRETNAAAPTAAADPSSNHLIANEATPLHAQSASR